MASYGVVAGIRLSNYGISSKELLYFRNSHMMIECCEDLKLRIWDDREGDVTQTIDSGPHIPLSCDVAHDGVHVIVSFNGFDGDGCDLKLYDIRKWNGSDSAIWTQPSAHQQAVNVCRFINASTTTNLSVLSGSNDETLRIWNIPHQNETYDGTNSGCILSLDECVNDISVIDDIVYVASNNGLIHVVKLSTDFEQESHIIAIGVSN
eukprot:7351_1